jgi:HEAT repeat protein
MKKRIFWSACAMTMFMVLGLFSPHIYWRIAGLCRGESFCAGKPTSYWRTVVKEEYQDFDWHPMRWQIVLAMKSLRRATLPPPSWSDTLSDWKQKWLGRKVHTWQTLRDDPDSLAVLTELFRDEDGEVRALAAVALCAKHDVGELLTELIEYLTVEAKEEVVDHVLHTGSAIADRHAIRLLCVLLDSDDKKAMFATRALWFFSPGPREAIPSLLKNLERKDPCNACQLLPKLGVGSVPALQRLLKSDNVVARRNATSTLAIWRANPWYEAAGNWAAFPDRVRLLIEQLEDPDSTIRCTAIDGLAGEDGKKNPEIAEALFGMFRDPDAEVRLCLIAQFKSDGLGAKDAAAEVRHIAAFDRVAEVRQAAAAALGGSYYVPPSR